MSKKRPFLDDLLCFLGDPVFQIPVRNFMDENCLIFDAEMEQLTRDHKDIHLKYKKLVDSLLDSFCKDSGIKLDDALKGIRSMSEIPDLREVFQVIFEQVSAANDFQIFARVMAKRNLIIQEQALVLLIAATGMVPTSFIVEGQEGRLKHEADEIRQERQKHEKSQAKRPEATAPPVSPPLVTHTAPGAGARGSAGATAGATAGGGALMMTADQEDQAVLQRALEASRQQHEKEQKQVSQKETEMVKQAEMESARLAAERAKLDQAMNRMVLQDKLGPTSSTKPSSSGGGGIPPIAPSSDPPRSTVAAPPQVSAEAVSGAQAAAQWLQSSQSEATKAAAAQSSTHAAHLQQMSKMSPEELKRRQEFLKEQRDKLLAMKKKDREQALSQAEQTTGRNRPQSARVAKASLAGGGKEAAAAPAVDPEEEKKMAMRRAIAEKLRSQVIGK